MATMLGGLLEQNVQDFQSRRRVATAVRGAVVFVAADREQSVTVDFGGAQIQVRDGGTAGAPTVSGPWLTMTKLCSGQVSPVRAWRSGELRLENPRRAPVAAAASFVLSVPPSFYGEPSPARRAVPPVVLGLVLVVGLTVIVRRRRRSLPS
jgi:hypothetical protein